MAGMGRAAERWTRCGDMMNGGLASVANQLSAYGRGPDTMLAHISPNEAALIDYMQGGRKTNPTTGLPEYSLFGRILKGLARAAGAIGGFIATGGNPLGAAAGAGIATKLTGGSWRQAGVGAALGGLGAGVGNLAGGAGFMGTTGLQGAAAGSVPLSQLGGLASQTVLPTGLAASLGSSLSGIGGLGGGLAGLGGALAEPRDQVQGFNMTPQPQPDANIIYNPNQPPQRQYVPFTGDYSRYGETGGEHAFYRPIERPIPLNVPGPSLGYRNPEEMAFMARGGASRAARIGRIYGPTDGSGMDDRVPALLTAGEHVLDREYVKLKGRGNVERGHQAIEREKRKVRKAAGIPAPYKPAVMRAMKRAGVG